MQNQVFNKATAAAPVATIVLDGVIVDAETGEVVGLEKPEFTVTDESSAEWVLERIMEAELDAYREGMKLRALSENVQIKINRANARAEWLRARFATELEEFARKKVEGSKSKTWSSPFGKLSFRTVKGGLRVLDKDLALAVAKSRGYTEAIKVTEEFQISKLSDMDRAYLEESCDGQAFIVKPDEEKFDIKTGVA